MIFTERTITVVNDSATINKPLILYRGDKNIELKITIVESQFKFRSTGASNVIETANASYAQLVINTPYDSPIFSEVTATENGTVIFVISAAMIDEVREVGIYDIQIRLLDDNKQSRASIPPVSNAIEIREPMAIEDGSPIDSNVVNVAKVNRALTTTSAPLEVFDSQGNYIKNIWGDGVLITDAALNKMEAGIDGVNKKVANVGTGGGTIPDNVVLFEETTDTPIIQETSIPINSQNGTTYYIKVDDNGALSVQNVNGETVWNGGSSEEIVKATGITLDKQTATIMQNNTITLVPTIEPIDCTQEVKWYTSNASIATVDNGVVTGRGIGNCTITAKVGTVSTTCELTVEKFVLLIWDSGSVNEEITGGWDYTTNTNYSYLNEDGNYVLKNSSGNWTVKHFVTRNVIDLSNYNKLILSIEVDTPSGGELQCQLSDNGTSVTSTYKYLPITNSTTQCEVDISEVTNISRLSFNTYNAQVTIKRIGLE